MSDTFFGVLQSLICSKKGTEGRNAQKSGTCQERIVRKEKLGSFIKVSVVVVPTNQDSVGLSPKGSAKQHEKQLTNTTKTFASSAINFSEVCQFARNPYKGFWPSG